MIEQPFQAPGALVCMQSFKQLLPKTTAPFRASFQGIVTELGQLDMTAQGEPKRSFTLVDSSGIWLPCVALAQNAENEQLQNGMELLLYFCTGRGPIGSIRGTVNLLKDAVIIGLKQHDKAPEKKTPVEIVDKE